MRHEVRQLCKETGKLALTIASLHPLAVEALFAALAQYETHGKADAKVQTKVKESFEGMVNAMRKFFELASQIVPEEAGSTLEKDILAAGGVGVTEQEQATK